MTRQELHVKLDEMLVAHKDSRGSAVTWDYIAGYYDAAGTVTQAFKQDQYLETRVLVWSKDRAFLEQVLAFMQAQGVEGSIEDAGKGGYERWRINVYQRESVVRCIDALLWHSTVPAQRAQLLDALRDIKLYLEAFKRDGI